MIPMIASAVLVPQVHLQCSDLLTLLNLIWGDGLGFDVRIFRVSYFISLPFAACSGRSASVGKDASRPLMQQCPTGRILDGFRADAYIHPRCEELKLWWRFVDVCWQQACKHGSSLMPCFCTLVVVTSCEDLVCDLVWGRRHALYLHSSQAIINPYVLFTCISSSFCPSLSFLSLQRCLFSPCFFPPLVLSALFLFTHHHLLLTCFSPTVTVPCKPLIQPCALSHVAFSTHIMDN